MTESPDDKKPETPSFPPQGSVTEHTLPLVPTPLSYQAEAGWISLHKIHKPIAHLFHTAYFAAPTADAGDNDRPLTFVFNGGPGAASAYLHMGALGPKRIAFEKSGQLTPPPVRVVDNLESWLAFTDLVFIDPLGTGFSRALQDEKKSKAKENADEDGPQENAEFWEIEKDLTSLGEFISRFLSKHHRWTSPLFIAGESYGGFRVAKMARRLQEQHGVGLCGAMLISPAIEFDSLFGSDYNLTHWVELFPSFVAAAHHHRLGGHASGSTSIEAAIQEGEAFAQKELVQLLSRGESLPADERDAIFARMSELIGLNAARIKQCGGRVTSSIYCRELFREQQRLCGRYDASITAVDPFPDRNDYEGPDPTLFSIDRVFTGAVNHQLRTELKVETDLEYRLLSRDVNEGWKDASTSHAFRAIVGAMDDLRYGMSLNEHMRVLITHGYFDLITPYFSSRRLVDLMKLTETQKQNLTTRNYHGGHMYYTWESSRQQFRQDAEQFVASAR